MLTRTLCPVHAAPVARGSVRRHLTGWSHKRLALCRLPFHERRQHPQLGNAEHWRIRLRYGRMSLVNSVKHGHNMMPTLKGALSTGEIEAAVDYILQRAGVWPKK